MYDFVDSGRIVRNEETGFIICEWIRWRSNVERYNEIWCMDGRSGSRLKGGKVIMR